MEVYEKLGVKPPDHVSKPEYSLTSNIILEAYNVIARSRRYEQFTPLALSLADIESYCDMYDVPVEIHIFVKAIMLIDDLFLKEVYESRPKK